MDNTFTFTVPGYTITVVGTEPVVAAPTVTEVDVKESDGSEVVADPVATPEVETPAEDATETTEEAA